MYNNKIYVINVVKYIKLMEKHLENINKNVILLLQIKINNKNNIYYLK